MRLCQWYPDRTAKALQVSTLPPHVASTGHSRPEDLLICKYYRGPEVFVALLHLLAPRQPVSLVAVTEVEGCRWNGASPQACRSETLGHAGDVSQVRFGSSCHVPFLCQKSVTLTLVTIQKWFYLIKHYQKCRSDTVDRIVTVIYDNLNAWFLSMWREVGKHYSTMLFLDWTYAIQKSSMAVFESIMSTALTTREQRKWTAR